MSARREGFSGLVINFHGVGEPHSDVDEGETDLWVTKERFAELLSAIAQHPSKEQIRVTFDDGNLSDYLEAAPLVLAHGLSAIVFVLSGRLERYNYLGATHLRELVALGIEVGTHGTQHVNWTRLNDCELAEELGSSKQMIEDKIGRSIVSAAIPFGQYNRRVLVALRRFKFEHVYSSDGGPRISSRHPIPRFSVRNETTPELMLEYIDKSQTIRNRILTELRTQLKACRLGPVGAHHD